jgi:hypothetical protein
VQACVQLGVESLDYGVKVVDSCLENRYAKFITNPMLDFTERSLDYLITPSQNNLGKKLKKTLKKNEN